MKTKVLTFISLLLFFSVAFSQAPNSFKYQSVLRKADGSILAVQNISIRISIIKDSFSGASVYSETQTAMSNSFGIINLNIGEGNVISGSFSDINWSQGSYFVKIEIDEKGGSNYSLSSSSQLLSVPFALYANKAGNAFSGDYNDLFNKPNLNIFEYDSIVMKTDDGKLFSLKVDTNGNLKTSRIIKHIEKKYLIDKDGNAYDTVIIGTQIWMKENLRTSKYNDGASIPLITEQSLWYKQTTPAFCWYNNDSSLYKKTNGALYNWYTVNTNKLCPLGWRVPNDADWKILIDYLGGENIAGGKLKDLGIIYWKSPNTGATNESGFSAIPVGIRDADGGVGDFTPINTSNYSSIWWSNTSSIDDSRVSIFYLKYNSSVISNSQYGKMFGLPVRCVKN